jgi:hypothetical protein
MEERVQALLDDIRAEFPAFRLIKKDESPFQRFLHGLLMLVTLGGQQSYLTSYQTTIGATVYVTPDWNERPAAQRWVTLRHERVHLRQFRRYGLVVMALLYLLFPLPAGLAWFRARAEKEAYAESIRAAAEVWGRSHVESPAFRHGVLRQFTSGAYGWMWPFRGHLERWYDKVLAAL